MADVQAPLLPGTLPSSPCYASEQQRLNAYMAVSHALLPGETFYNIGPTKPAPDKQGFPWFNTTDDQWYRYEGVWKRKIPEYDINERRMFVGTPTELLSAWGGDGSAAAPTPISGATWEIDPDFAGRSPMAPGDIPTANPAKTLSVEENYGAGSHAQTVNELAPHTHSPNPTLADGFWGRRAVGAVGTTVNVTGGTDTILLTATGYAGGNGTTPASPGTTDAAPIIHPVRGTYIVRRTVRTYFTVP